ncbi:MAG: D-2-hydroxyacid dehydrogenase, partial [Actinomycetota bacterium]|nr:D-2-hydroxyacid dehydrogenase [Actinomycetota bacterium]
MPAERVVVVIASPLEAELVTLIEAVDGRLEVRYQPDLLPPPRFPCDHRGAGSFRRAPEQEKRWRALLASAEVLFGWPGDAPGGLADAVRASPGLRWVQATAGGAGEQVRT